MICDTMEEEYERIQYERHIKQIAYDMMKNKREHLIGIKTNHPEIIKRVNFRKQGEVERLLNVLDENKALFENCTVILFGSSTNGLCGWRSDIDLCIDINISDAEKYRRTKRALVRIIRSTLTSECDVLIKQDLSPKEKILGVVQREGVIIWQN